MYNNSYHSIDLSHSRFLITGGAGFIGSNLVEYLMKHKAGHVRVLDNLATGIRKNIEPYFNEPNFEFIEGDIRDFQTCVKAVQDIDYVSHQAALGSVPRSISDPLTTNEVNISGFLNVLVAVKDASTVKRMVYAASSSTYGDSKKLPKTEGNEGKPLSPYAVTKAVNEIYADVFSTVYGLHTIGLRYFNIFGPRQSPNGSYAAVIPLFVDAIVNNISPYINGDGEQTRDFTFVENAVQANILAMLTTNTESSHQVYNIAVGERISLNQLFNLIKEVWGKPDLEPLYRSSRKGDIRDSLADISKAKKMLGYHNVIGLKQGLNELRISNQVNQNIV